MLIDVSTLDGSSLVGLGLPSGPGSRAARIHTSCAVVVAPTFDRAFAR